MNNLKHGYGELTKINGEIYQGMFVKDEKSGFGTITFSDGKEYSGEWKNNQ